PALILAYLARERPSRVTVSSVLAFRALRGLRAERFGGRPRFDWTFFLELLLLCLAVLAVAGPYLLSPSSPLALVLDNSAATQAGLAGGGNRFAVAVHNLDRALAAHEGGGEVAVYVTAPQPHRIAPPFVTIAAARAAIAKLTPTDAPADSAAVGALLSSLASERRYTKVIYAGAHPIVVAAAPGITAFTVGDPIQNYAIGSFVLRREVFGAEALHARIKLANFAAQTRDLEVIVSGDGRIVARAKSVLGPGETGQLEFPELPAATVYRAELAPADGFPLDNTAFATVGSLRAVSVLFVSPTPDDAKGLESIPGVAVLARTPDAYAPSELAGADVAVFEYAAPKELPPVNALFVMPPPAGASLGLGVKQAAAVQIASWRKTDPLADSVNFRLLNLRAGEMFGVHPWMSAVVEGQDGGLLLRGERDGHRYVAAGFNLFPYLGGRNLPMSVLTLNVMSYLAGLSADSSGYRTGQPWLVPAGITEILLPSGRTVAVTAGSIFSDVAAQGVYELIGADGARSPRAVNLADFAESDLAHAAPIHVEVAAGQSAPRSIMHRVPMSGLVLFIILALATLEAAVVYRRRHRSAEVGA
ncbi:MAG: hypothetical protein ACREQB_07435, partial [Candidatus Binataceae bacterium]